MGDFISQYQYHIAWTIYLICGGIFCLVLWRLTGPLKHSGWRDLIRVIGLVMIYTPWYVSEAHDYTAPAVMVVAMDMLLGSTDNGLAGSMAILVSTASMLAFLIVKRVLRRNHDD